MKLPGVISRSNRCRRQNLAGQIMAEAAIGLALLVFVWILVSYTNYMGINRIRTNMAARHSAWLSGHGADPTANGLITSNFFLGNDANLVTVAPPVTNSLNLFGISIDPNFLVGASPEVYSNTVTFGVANVNSSSPFPFNLLMVNVPFMPTDLLDSFKSFTMVSSHCAWPADVWNICSEPTLAVKIAEGGLYAGIFF